MSLVPCPKCGGQISDKSGSCIHCGFAFKICPECGAVLAKDAPRCTECGKQFGEENAAEPLKQESKPQTAEVTKFDGYMDEFTQRRPIYRDKVQKTASRILTALGFLFLAVDVILAIIAFRKEGIEYVVFVARTLLPFIVFFVLTILTDTGEYLFKKWWQFAKDTAFQDWCRQEKGEEIRGLSPEEYRAIVKDNGLLRARNILHDYECPEGKKTELFDVIGKCALRIAVDVSLLVGVVQIMEKVAFSSSPQASWIYTNVPLICALCLFGARIIFWFFTYSVFRKQWTKWLSSAKQRAEKMQSQDEKTS